MFPFEHGRLRIADCGVCGVYESALAPMAWVRHTLSEKRVMATAGAIGAGAIHVLSAPRTFVV